MKTVAELTGISRNTIVAWERRYGVIQPQRGDNHYRQYTDADVAKLLELKTLVDSGYRISEAVELVREGRVAGVAPGPQRGGLVLAVAEVQHHLLSFDRAAADAVRARLSTVPFRQVIDHLLTPLVVAVGHGWERGVCTVAQEHFSTAWVRDQLVAMLLQLECGPTGGRTVACATPPGERHELGLLGLSVQLALLGRRVSYLGPDLPLSALQSYALAQRPAVVCLSLIQLHDEGAVRRLAEDVRAILPLCTALFIGGGGLPPSLDLSMPGVRCSSRLSAELIDEDAQI